MVSRRVCIFGMTMSNVPDNHLLATADFKIRDRFIIKLRMNFLTCNKSCKYLKHVVTTAPLSGIKPKKHSKNPTDFEMREPGVQKCYLISMFWTL